MELEPRTEKDLIELTEIPAPPFKEEKRGLRYAEMLREAGMSEVEIDGVGNVRHPLSGNRRGRDGGGLVAHLDTVFPEGTDVTVKREGNRLLAPGIGDDTRGLALMLTVVRAMLRSGVKTRGDILFVASVGEEGLGDLRGVKHLFREGGPEDRSVHRRRRRAAPTAFSTKPSDPIGTRVTFKGPGGHSWGAFGLGNPAHALSRFIYHFDEEAGEFVITGPRTSYNIGRIGGGTSVNAIPFENWAEVDMRSEDPEQLKKIDAIMKKAVDRALKEQNERKRRGDPLTVEVELLGDRPSGTVDPSSPLIQRALAATRHFGVEPQLETGSTDANVPIALGIPATTIGRGGEGEGAHALHEWWSNVDGHLGIQKALLLVVACAGLSE